MDKIANVKSQLRLPKWAQIFSDCQASDMTVAAWCEANNINIKSYYYWLRKVRNHTSKTYISHAVIPICVSPSMDWMLSSGSSSIWIHSPRAFSCSAAKGMTVSKIVIAIKTQKYVESENTRKEHIPYNKMMRD